MRMRWQVLLVSWGLVLVAAGSGFAAGFALIEQSVSGLGTAFSGAAAAEDATTIYFNPAGMTLLEGTQAVGSLHYINPSAKLQLGRATNVLGNSLGSDSGGNGGRVGYVPNTYVSSRAGRLAYGLGINAPFGLSTEYDKAWVGRYHAVKSSVRTININPSAAVAVNDWLSLGAGVSAQYLDVQLSNMVDFGLSAYSSTGNAALLPFVSNTLADVYADMNAESWGYGYNLGAMVKYAEGGRIGLAYRSRIEHTVKGDADFSAGMALTAQANAAFPDQGVKGNITLPATASVNIYQEITPTWAVTADVTWTEWSTFGKLVIEFDQGVGSGTSFTTTSTTTEDWADSWRYAVGTTVKASDALTLRGGLAYDETPITDASDRTPRIPDEDRFWVALGCGYKMSDRTSIDLGYAHLFVKDAQINKVDTGTGENKGRGNLFGSYNNHVDILSAQLTYKF